MKINKLTKWVLLLAMLLTPITAFASLFDDLLEMADNHNDPFNGHWIGVNEKIRSGLVIEFTEDQAIVHRLDRRLQYKREAKVTLASDNTAYIIDSKGVEYTFHFNPEDNTGSVVTDDRRLAGLVLKRGHNSTQDEIDGTWVDRDVLSSRVDSNIFRYEGGFYYSSHLTIYHNRGVYEEIPFGERHYFKTKDGIEFTEQDADGNDYTFFVIESDGQTRKNIDNSGTVWTEFKSNTYQHPEIPSGFTKED